MKCKCGSYAINPHLHGRDGSDEKLCDVCYWRKRAMKWRTSKPKQPCIAYDKVGKSAGLLSNGAFESFTKGYFFAVEEDMKAYRIGTKRCVGHITLWQPLPEPPGRKA